MIFSTQPIGMIVSLIVLHWLFANEWKASEVYKIYGGLATLAFCFYLGWMIMQKNGEKKYVSESKGCIDPSGRYD